MNESGVLILPMLEVLGETFGKEIDVYDNTTDAPLALDALASNKTTPREHDVQVLRNTFSFYGSLFAAAFLLFCVVRVRLRKIYNIRSRAQCNNENPKFFHRINNVKPISQTYLANNSYGFFSWAWNLFLIDDLTFQDECGFDALCFIRICSMGYKLTLAGIFASIWLIPVYATSESEDIEDPLTEMTASHVPMASRRLIATAVASYFVFGHCMYTILKEMEWFTKMRHRFLCKPNVRNYSIYIRNIPKEWRCNKGLQNFFERSLRGINVIESSICLATDNLKRKVDERELMVEKLEHAVAMQDEFGVRPKHVAEKGLVHIPNLILPIGKKVDSISFFTKSLKAVNENISIAIDKLQAIANQAPAPGALECDEDSDLENDFSRHSVGSVSRTNSLIEVVRKNTEGVVRHAVTENIRNAGKAKGLVVKGATGAVKLVIPDGEDGHVFSAGFVVFGTLSTAHAARQMLHHEKPYAMEVIEAPDPDDVFWSNVGREHQDLQLGRLASFALSSLICLFWTVPTSFVAGVSSTDALRKEISFVDNLLEKFPGLEALFSLLAPQLLVMLNALLPVILTYVTTFEGLISGSKAQASLFTKLATFMIVQTFFVSAISGGIYQEIQRMVNSPSSLMDLLATTLPAQSTFFIQTVFVYSVTAFITEGLGLSRIALAIVRSFVGPALTDRERKKAIMFLRPFGMPKDFEFAINMRILVLLFMVYLVYAAIAPMVTFVTAFCFGLLEALFRHQFVYVYRSKPDSGGHLWMNFMKILTVCMLIAELTVVGMMILKKTAMATLCFPLVVVSIIFGLYVREKHFSTALNLPTRLCLKHDERNRGIDFGFEGSYLQPELRDKEVEPNLPPIHLVDLGFHIPSNTDLEGIEESDLSLTSFQSRAPSESAMETPSYDPTIDTVATSEGGIETYQTTCSNGVTCRITRFEIPEGVGLGDKGTNYNLSSETELGDEAIYVASEEYTA